MKTTFVIVGITGDLSRRKLLPALRQIHQRTDHEFSLVGVSRREVDIAGLVGEELAAFSRLFMMDLANAADYDRLYKEVVRGGEQTIIYLSVPPLAVPQIVAHMGAANFNQPGVKILFEKPFGIDAESAKEMIAETSSYFDESALYRIDHYLAKEMAQNIVTFRTQNALFAQVWNNRHIERIELVASEKIGIEGRAEFYEQTGALRDVLQGHLMQLLSLVLMDVPASVSWDDVPAQRLKALQQLVVANPTESVRGQYEGYDIEAHNPGSRTETFVGVTLRSQAPEWQGIPIVVMTGKALAKKTTEIRIHFTKSHDSQSNCLLFRIQPHEGVEIALVTKKPGYSHELEQRQLAFSYPPDAELPDAYEQVLVDAIDSRKSLFTSSAEILESWRVLQPLLDAWSMEQSPMVAYPKGSTPESLYSPT